MAIKPDCEAVRHQLMGYLRGELDEAKRREIEAHVVGCEDCRKEWEVACRVLAITDTASGPEVDRRLEEILSAAAERKASDIHLEPQREGMRVRLRIDGALREQAILDSPTQQALLHRLKLRLGMDLTESRKPQQGRFHWEREGIQFEFRGGTLPQQYGERLTLRMFRPGAVPTFEQVGLPQDLDWHTQPNGLILISGPTGSGKTTTAYSMAQRATGPEWNTMAVGSGPYFLLEGVNQMDLMGAGNMSYGDALRAIYAHQDPDVLLIEETREEEVAEMAVELALTGHLVITAIHAGHGSAAARRMLDLGIDPDPLANALLGISSQRLVRRVCPECATTSPGDPVELDKLGLPAGTPVKSIQGCDACDGRGWKGRIALYSLHDFSKGQLSQFPVTGSREELISLVERGRTKTLRESGAEAVQAGVTTPAEALRVLPPIG
jgi:type II secretory ATPase GspE/PulE/Tfp pilus assembly ATPase PilB-like protein